MSAHEIDPIIDRYIDGELDAESFARLQDWINAAPANAQRFMRRITMHDALRDAPKRVGGAKVRTAPPVGRPAPVRTWLAVAAAVGIATAVVAVYFLLTGQPDPVEPDPRPAMIATLVESTGSLSVADDLGVEGRDYPAGVIEQSSGSAEFVLSSRVGVKLTGDTRLTLHDPMSTTIARGTASFRCPAGAEGFTVHLPGGAKIVDVGTAFRVRVDDDGRASVSVTEGEVLAIGVDGVEHALAAGERMVHAGGVFSPTKVRRIDVEGVLGANADAAANLIGSFGADDLGPGDVVVIDLDVEPNEPERRFNWFVIAVNPGGFLGWTGADAGALLRTDRVTEFVAHQHVANGRVSDLARYTDDGIANGGGRIRVEIALVDGFGADAEYVVMIDDDRDGAFDHTTEGVFAVGARLEIGLAAHGGAHRYRPAVTDEDQTTPPPGPENPGHD